jgi:hypothetical protein
MIIIIIELIILISILVNFFETFSVTVYIEEKIRHAAPNPNKLRQGQEEEEGYICYFLLLPSYHLRHVILIAYQNSSLRIFPTTSTNPILY